MEARLTQAELKILETCVKDCEDREEVNPTFHHTTVRQLLETLRLKEQELAFAELSFVNLQKRLSGTGG